MSAKIVNDDDSDDDSIAKCKKAAAAASFPDDLSLDMDDDYILGTLVVRVVAARDLEPVPNRRRPGGGLGLFSSSSSTNPYASVEFRDARQRTSVAYNTTDPIWPRAEALYLDVSLPESNLTYAAGMAGMPKPKEEPEPAGKKLDPDDDEDEDATLISTRASSFASNDVHEMSLDYDPPNATMTIALFHAAERAVVENNQLYPDKKTVATDGDSDDFFLGMTSIDLTQLFTGRRDVVDEWLTIEGGNNSATVRIICEYEPSDGPLKCGDLCRLTTFCRPADIFPVPTSQQFAVVAVDWNANTVTLSYRTSTEGWECTFVVHRYMVICDERYYDSMAVYKQELQSISDRLSGSLLIKELSETAERVAVDGLVNIGQDVVRGGVALFSRWMSGGIDTAVADVAHATNWDGQNYYTRVDLDDVSDLLDEEEEPQHEPVGVEESKQAEHNDDDDDDAEDEEDPLPNMPQCPITGEPMINPVVAADGHTYERKAIARWLQTSDMSPMTGGVLAHKDLVPNYVLLSSLQEAAKSKQAE